MTHTTNTTQRRCACGNDIEPELHPTQCEFCETEERLREEYDRLPDKRKHRFTTMMFGDTCCVKCGLNLTYAGDPTDLLVPCDPTHN